MPAMWLLGMLRLWLNINIVNPHINQTRKDITFCYSPSNIQVCSWLWLIAYPSMIKACKDCKLCLPLNTPCFAKHFIAVSRYRLLSARTLLAGSNPRARSRRTGSLSCKLVTARERITKSRASQEQEAVEASSTNASYCAWKEGSCRMWNSYRNISD